MTDTSSKGPGTAKRRTASELAVVRNDSTCTDNDDALPLQKKPKQEKQQQHPVAHSKKKKEKLTPEILNVRRKIQQCCKHNDLATAMQVYDEALLADVRVEAQSFYNLLNLCDGLGNDRGGERKVHIGTPKPKVTTSSNSNARMEEESTVVPPPPPVQRSVDAETRQRYAFRIKRQMDELKLPLNETAYTALIRLLSKARRFEQAEQLLTEAEGVSQCMVRLRLYSSLLCAYCEVGQMESALKLWTRLVKQELVLTEREYAALIQCAIQTGNSTIMERVLSDLAEDVLIPSNDTTRLISDWFTSPHATVASPGNNDSKNCTSSQSSFDSIELPASDAPSMGPVQCNGGGGKSGTTGWIVTYGCRVDTHTGAFTTGCLKGECLRPVTLSDKNWNEMKAMNETIVLNGMLDKDKSAFQGGGKGLKRRTPSQKKDGFETRKRHWNDFQSYLQERKHFDIVIDGANVGYYKQNFANAPKHVDYRQVDDMLKHFANQSKSVLLIMHERHFYPRLLPSWAVPIVESWKNVLYRTPSGMNDDWFWMHAALWSGRTTLVVTNDEMRDHFFQMLAPRSFLRWKERHQVHFHLAWRRAGGDDDNGDEDSGGGRRRRHRLVELTYPETYSRRIQRVPLQSTLSSHHQNHHCPTLQNDQQQQFGLVVPLAKRGDEHRYLDGTHTANDDCPVEETYLCIRPT